MYDSSFDSTETQPYFEAGSLIKLENGECKKVEELSRADFETVRTIFNSYHRYSDSRLLSLYENQPCDISYVIYAIYHICSNNFTIFHYFSLQYLIMYI